MKQKLRFLMLTLLCAVFSTAWGQSDYSTRYMSNVQLSNEGGTSASACKVNINGTEYPGIKAGTSSVAGAWQVKVPAGTKYLHLHLAGWSNESVTLSVTPTGYTNSISLTANSGISGNSPFTFSGNPYTSAYYKVITFDNPLTSETNLTFTATSGKRFVVFGVTWEDLGDTPTVQDIATINSISPTSIVAGGSGTFTADITPASELTSSDYTVSWYSPSTNLSVSENGAYTTSVAGTESVRVTVTPRDGLSDTYQTVIKSFDVSVTAPPTTVPFPWTEDFSGNYPLDNYSCVNGGSKTEIKNEKLADGTAPELLISKNGGSFTACILLDDNYGEMTLTFKANYDRVTITADGGTLGDVTFSNKTYSVPITVAQGTNILTLTFTNSNDSNVRVDDFELKKTVLEPVLAVTPYTTIVSAEGKSGELAIVATNIDTDNVSDVSVSWFDENNNPLTGPSGNWFHINSINKTSLSYTVAPNEGEARTAKFKVVYSFGTGSPETIYSDMVTITQEAYVAPVSEYVIDFENEASSYVDWTFTNIVSNISGVDAHGGSKYGSTNSKTSGSIKTNDLIATPYSLTCYLSKTTNNNNGTWYIQVSNNGSDWETVVSKSASNVTNGSWTEFTADLSEYSDVYVRVYYDGGSSTAVRLIDDLTLLTTAPDKYYVAGDWTDWANGKIEMTRNSDGTYTLNNQVVKVGQEFKIIKVAAGTTTDIYCGGNADGNYWGINPDSHTNIVLNVGGGQNFKMAYLGTWSFTVNPKGNTPLLSVDGDWQMNYYLVGSFNVDENNNWVTTDAYKFLKDNDTKYTLTKTIDQGESFKILGSDGTWYSAISDGPYWFEEKDCGEELSLTTANDKPNFLMKLSNKNEWSIEFNPTNMKLVLSGFVSDVAEIPFEFYSGSDDIGPTAGLTQSGLGTYSDSDSKLKFDSTGDYLILHFNDKPGTLTFNIKGNNFTSGTFAVQTSVDGSTYTDLETYTELAGSNKFQEFDLGENIRYIKWIFTEHGSGNVGVGNITLGDKFVFTIYKEATDGTYYYATIADLGEGYFKVPKGLEIYAVSVENNKLSPIRIPSEAIPGNGAYLVKSDAAGQYTFYATPSPETEVTLGDNMLVSTGESGVTEAEMANAYPESGYKFYKLALHKKTKKVGFLWGAENGAAFTYTKGHQAYLPVLTSTTGNSVSAYYFDDTTDVTGINDVYAESVTTKDIYTLSGVRMDGATLPKGIYIVNGKKMVIK